MHITSRWSLDMVRQVCLQLSLTSLLWLTCAIEQQLRSHANVPSASTAFMQGPASSFTRTSYTSYLEMVIEARSFISEENLYYSSHACAFARWWKQRDVPGKLARSTIISSHCHGQLESWKIPIVQAQNLMKSIYLNWRRIWTGMSDKAASAWWWVYVG